MSTNSSQARAILLPPTDYLAPNNVDITRLLFIPYPRRPTQYLGSAMRTFAPTVSLDKAICVPRISSDDDVRNDDDNMPFEIDRDEPSRIRVETSPSRCTTTYRRRIQQGTSTKATHDRSKNAAINLTFTGQGE